MSSLHLVLTRDPSSPAVARRHVGEFAAAHEIDHAPTVLLVVSELITNAVLHGEEPIELSVACAQGRVRIEVSDANPDTSVVAARDRTPDRPGGWGLHIVANLAPRWGAVAHEAGKTVWVEVDLDEPGEKSAAG